MVLGGWRAGYGKEDRFLEKKIFPTRGIVGNADPGSRGSGLFFFFFFLQNGW